MIKNFVSWNMALKPFITLSLLLFCSHIQSYNAAEYVIRTSWNNVSIEPSDQVTVKLDKLDAKSFKIDVQAPFYNDAPPNTPGNKAGEPTWGLWEFELIKIFFMNDQKQYLEIELGPWGHHWVLLLNGYRHAIQIGMLIKHNAKRDNKKWEGAASIPLSYLPVNVTKMNIYSYHGPKEKRIVNSLYPVGSTAAELDDHKLEAFQPFDSNMLVEPSLMSTIWSDALQGVRSFQITHSWNGQELSVNEAVNLHMQIDASNTNMILNVSAPFYNDRAPEKATGGPFATLYTYEVVHVYMLSYPDLKYVEIELGPWGHYLVVFWNGYWNKVGDLNSPLKYSANRSQNRWDGSALIPLDYLPPKVYLMNAHSSHGLNDARKYNSLYPVPPDSNQTEPNYHALQYYKFFDLSLLYEKNEDPKCSKVWEDMNACRNSAVRTETSSIAMLLFNVLILFLFSM